MNTDERLYKEFRCLDTNLDLRSRTSYTLILVKKSGRSGFANSSMQDKDMLISNYKPEDGDILLVSWEGQWRNDVFLLSEQELDTMYKVPVGPKKKGESQKYESWRVLKERYAFIWREECPKK